MKRCYYEILEVSREASADLVKRAYRKKALEYHPDRNPEPEAENLFKEASEAYEVLTDPEKRTIYDQFGHQGLDQRGMHHGYSDVTDIFSHFSDIFEDFFGMGTSRRSRRGRVGRDLRYALALEFMEAFHGVEKKFKITRPETCSDCEGKGHPPEVQPQSCEYCQGTGQLLHNQGFITISSPCGACQGRGATISERCAPCSGRGQVEVQKNLKVKVPAGVEDGMQLCLRGEGEAGSMGAPAGDLYVELSVQVDPRWHRQGKHLIMEQSVEMPLAALGGEIFVETPEKEMALEIPAGVQNGELLQLKKMGMPDVQGGSHGDLHVKINVKTPTKLTSKQKEMLKNWDESSPKKSSLSKKSKKSKKSGLFRF